LFACVILHGHVKSSIKTNLCLLTEYVPVMPATRRSLFGDRAFAVAGPRAWNSLPQFVTDCSSPHSPSRNISTYLFSLYF